jgi:ADP-heptose:LPS heptosyltransferase
MDKKVPRILVIRPEKLGDLVVATPVLRALRHSYPGSLITVLTDRTHGCILHDDPHVDEVLEIDWKWRNRGEHEPAFSIIRKIRPHRFELALVLYPNWSGWNVVAALSGIPRVVQLGGTWGAKVLGHEVIRRRAFERNLHYRDYYLEVAATVGAHLPSGDDGMPRVYLPDKEKEDFLKRFPREDERKRIILHPFGHGSSPNYSLKSYASVARMIADELGVEVFVTGGRGDLVSWESPNHPLIRTDWLGRLTLREMMSACANVDAVLCGSTGIIHLAAALGVPTVGLYCPSPGSHPKAWGALGTKSTALVVPELVCHKMKKSSSSCSGNQSCDLICGIEPETVVMMVQKTLSSC